MLYPYVFGSNSTVNKYMDLCFTKKEIKDEKVCIYNTDKEHELTGNNFCLQQQEKVEFLTSRVIPCFLFLAQSLDSELKVVLEGPNK